MKLLLRRNQKSGMLSSKITFTLDVRAELTPDEQGSVNTEASNPVTPGSPLGLL